MSLRQEESYGGCSGNDMAHREAIKKMAVQDPGLMADRGGAFYHPASQEFSLVYCGERHFVSFPAGIVRRETPGEISGNDRTLLVLYLACASGLPLRGRWISFLELPGGPHHHAPFQEEAVYPLAKELGGDPKLFMAAADSLGGLPAPVGRFGSIIPALPHIPLAVGIWPGDEEFPASRAVILFDVSATTHLDTAALYVLGVNVSHKLRAKACPAGR